jgi:U3 small nucleolar RNA-associated protein 5
VELFEEPFAFATKATDKATDLKSKRKQMTKKAAAKIQISRSGQKNVTMPIVALSFQDGDLVLAYLENGVSLAFERRQWANEQQDGLLLRGQVSIEKTGTTLGIDGAGANGVKKMSGLNVDESKAVVSRGADTEPEAMAVDKAEVIDISSAEEVESDSGEDEDEEEATPPSAQKPRAVGAHTNGVREDEEMQDAASADQGSGSEGEEEEEEVAEPSFGELLRQNGAGQVDVAAAFPNAQDKDVIPFGKRVSKLPGGMSLGTVLTQALRTNDTNLLESCLHEQDLNVVRATIERLDSTLAAVLLKKLAERLHNRPGRAGSLMVWVQWTLVAHGGYLGSQPDVMKQLSALHRVVKERASSLQPLLSLKGKLDMLEAQMTLRKSMQSRYNVIEGAGNDEEGVIYVEGQEDSSDEASSSDEGADEDEEDLDEDEDEDMDDIDEAVDDESAEGSENGLIDDIASETDADSGDELGDDDMDHDDVDSFDEESEDEPAPKSKSKTKLPNGISSKKR